MMLHTIPVDARGWARLPGTLKAHYFPGDNQRSLCGRWGPDNVDPALFYDGDHRSSDNCAACRTRRERVTPN
jgi:hypothetical protein